MWLRGFSRDHPRRGYRSAWRELRREGRQVNRKRVQRLWRAEGLRVPQKGRKKRLTGIGVHVGQMSLIALDALWAMDFQFDLDHPWPAGQDAHHHRRVHPRGPRG